MKEKDVKVKIYGESKTHGFDMHTEMSFEDYCQKKGYIVYQWHNVKDGDLPKMEEYVLCKTIWEDEVEILYFKNNEWHIFHDSASCYDINCVVAWTELPKYNGE